MKFLFKRIKSLLKRVPEKREEELNSAYIEGTKNITMGMSVYEFCKMRATTQLAQARIRALHMLYLGITFLLLEAVRLLHGERVVIIPNTLLGLIFIITYILFLIKINHRYYFKKNLIDFKVFETKVQNDVFNETVRDEIDDIITDIEDK